ncbi:MAG: glycine cleavage system protein GcvH [Elusimicrobia bacterium]|nr:glycine cleavage system protein GcvH [Elusimicrobiota bacterium]
MEVRDSFFYTKEHEWVKVDENKGIVGITDYASQTLGDITFVEVASVGKDVSQFGYLGTIESVKAASDIFSPVSGKVIEVNEKATVSPEIINTSPYTDGWLAIIEMSASDEVKNLMTAEQYKEYIKNL